MGGGGGGSLGLPMSGNTGCFQLILILGPCCSVLENLLGFATVCSSPCYSLTGLGNATWAGPQVTREVNSSTQSNQTIWIGSWGWREGEGGGG